MTWTLRILLCFLVVVLFSLVSYAGTITRVTKPNGTTAWVTGDTVTPTDLNGDFDAIVSEFNGGIDTINIGTVLTSALTGCVSGACSDPFGPQNVDDYSADEDEMNNILDPSESGSVTLPTDMEDELEVLRYAVKRLSIGDSIYRDNAALVDADWWEFPVRGPNLVINGSMQMDADADGTADGWTLVDGAGGGAPTLALVSGTQAEGYGRDQKITATAVGDGVSQVITRLKASTRYLIVARVKVGAGDTTELTTAGALAASEWDDIVTARSLDFTTTTLTTKGVVIKTDATPTDITISLLGTNAADVWTVSDVAMYELSEEYIPTDRQGVFYTEKEAAAGTTSAGTGAYVVLASPTGAVIPPYPDYTVSVDSDIAILNNACGATVLVCLRLMENAVAVGNIPCVSVDNNEQASAHLHYLNTSPTAGTSLTYTVQEKSSCATITFHTSAAGTASQMSIEARPR